MPIHKQTPKEYFYYYQKEGENGHTQKLMYSTKSHKYLMNIVKSFYNSLGKKVSLCLDVGCAEGWYTRWMGQRSAFAVGIDISYPKIKRASLKSSEKVSYIVSNWDFLPFKNLAFDVILYVEGIEHALNPKKSLKEILRVTKQCGYLILSTIIGPPIEEENPFGKSFNGHLRRFTQNSLRALIHPYLRILKEDMPFKKSILSNFFDIILEIRLPRNLGPSRLKFLRSTTSLQGKLNIFPYGIILCVKK